MSLQATAFDVESYLHGKGLTIRRRGSKAELRDCPFCHGGEHKDLWKCVVYLDSSPGNYKCMRGSCGATGSFWGLLEFFGDDPKEFYSREHPRIDRNNRPTVSGLPIPKSYTFPPAPPLEPQQFTPQALAYLQSRGFSEDVLDRLPIWCDEQGLVNFGYYRNGDLCMVKVRVPRKPNEGEQKAWQKWKGGLRTLWCQELCDPQLPQLVIVFGEYDCIALYQAGLMNVVSVPCGDMDLEWIDICWDFLQQFDEIILWPDNDQSGHESLVRISQRLGPEKIKVVKTQYKDANDFLWQRGREVADEVDSELRDAVYGSEWYHSGNLCAVESIVERERSYKGYTSGILGLDRALGKFFFKQLVLHIGNTKHGKSTAVNQITAMAIYEGAKACVWPGEDAPDDYQYKMFLHLAGPSRVDRRTSDRTGTEYAVVPFDVKQEIAEYLSGRLQITGAQRELMTEDALLQNFRLAYQRYGCDVFVVDNLMKLVVSKPSTNVFQRQAEICNKLSEFANETGSIVHLVCHTNKTGGVDQPPTGQSVSGAQEILNLCDRALFWWKVPEKMRHKYQGRDSVTGIIADRSFGNELELAINYDKLSRRFFTEQSELFRDYLNPYAQQFTSIYGGND